MSKLTVRVSDALYDSSEVLVNGQKEKFTKNGRGGYELVCADCGETEIQITRKHELTSNLWLLWSMLFFVISCFGIFDVRYGNVPSLRCKVKVSPTEDCALRFTPGFKKNGEGVIIAQDKCEAEILENSSDAALIKKRRKILRLIKIMLWLALIAAIVLVVIL